MKTDYSFAQVVPLLAATQLLLIIDTSIINVIVPGIASELAFTPAGQSWIANAYLIVFGGALLLAGRVSDFVGRVGTFQAGLFLLAIGSIIAAIANTPTTLIVGRAVQGLGSALSAASALALIFALFEGGERAKALGLLAAMGGLGGAVGTFLGGALAEVYGWRSTFWVSAIAAFALLVAGTVALRKLATVRTAGKIDFVGGILLLIGQTCLIFGIVLLGERLELTFTTLAPIGIGLAILVGSTVSARFVETPLIPGAFWKNGTLLSACLFAIMAQFAIFPMFFIGNLYIQVVLGQDAFLSGAAFLPLCGVVVVSAAMVGRIIPKLGTYATLALGFLALSSGLIWLSFMRVDGTILQDVIGPTLIFGFGLPVVGILANVIGGSAAKIGEEGLVSGVLNTSQQFGSVLGLAVTLSAASAYSQYLASGSDGYLDPLHILSGYSLAIIICALVSGLAFVLAVMLGWLRRQR